jgi:hypothetical protein
LSGRGIAPGSIVSVGESRNAAKAAAAGEIGAVGAAAVTTAPRRVSVGGSAIRLDSAGCNGAPQRRHIDHSAGTGYLQVGHSTAMLRRRQNLASGSSAPERPAFSPRLQSSLRSPPSVPAFGPRFGPHRLHRHSRSIGVVGTQVTVKLVPLVPVPPAVVTAIGPVVAPAGTAAVIVEALSVVMVAETPLKVRLVAFPRLVPEIVTTVPTAPDDGLKPVIFGALITLKLATLTAVPPPVVTLIVPVVAPAGTVVVIFVAVFVRIAAALPLNESAVAPERLTPVIVTPAPTPPDAGVKPAMQGTPAATMQ